MLSRDEWIEQLENANGDIAKTQFFQSLTEKSYHWIAENFQNLSELHKESIEKSGDLKEAIAEKCRRSYFKFCRFLISEILELVHDSAKIEYFNDHWGAWTSRMWRGCLKAYIDVQYGKNVWISFTDRDIFPSNIQIGTYERIANEVAPISERITNDAVSEKKDFLFQGSSDLDQIKIRDDAAWRATVTWMEQKLKVIVERALPAMNADGISNTDALIQVCDMGYESFSKDFFEFKTLKNPKIDHDGLIYYLKGVESFVGIHFGSNVADLVIERLVDRLS